MLEEKNEKIDYITRANKTLIYTRVTPSYFPIYKDFDISIKIHLPNNCLLYTSPSPRD